MLQVISIIDENALIDDFRDLNFDGSNVDEIFKFATASSEFYPNLANYYDAQNESWRDDQNKELAQDSTGETSG